MRVFLVAGEASGDALGGAVMAGLREIVPDVRFAGVGGPRMQASGLESLFPMDELSVMGLAEILPRYRQLHNRLHQTVRAVLEAKPDILLTIDSPDFTLRVARLVRAKDPDIRIVHYVAPSVWAWRPGRAAKMTGIVDQVLALLPFEPPYMEAAGMRCDFVGHPVVSMPVASVDQAAAYRSDVLAGGDGPLVLVLPGSRKSEVTRLAPIFGAALADLAQRRPGLRAVLPAAAPVVPLVRGMVQDWTLPVTVIDPAADPDGRAKRAAFRAADVALAASGTVSLELAASQTPMVIGYDMAWLTIQIMHRLIRVDTVTLVNLVSETRTVPEFVGKTCRPETLALALEATLAAPEAQRAAMETTMVRLGRDGDPPGLRAARAVLDGLENA